MTVPFGWQHLHCVGDAGERLEDLLSGRDKNRSGPYGGAVANKHLLVLAEMALKPRFMAHFLNLI